MRTILLSVVFTSAVVLAQVPPEQPRFEVVSIKLNTSNALGCLTESPDRIY